MTAQQRGAHTTVPQQAAAAAGPWEAYLAAACSPGQGTPCPWLAALPGLADSTAPAGATCSPQCAQLPAQPWCACCAWLAGGYWALALRLLPVWPPGCCVGPVGPCGGPPPGTTSGPALAGHANGSRLGAAGAGPPALLGASNLQAWWAAHGSGDHPYACRALAALAWGGWGAAATAPSTGTHAPHGACGRAGAGCPARNPASICPKDGGACRPPQSGQPHASCPGGQPAALSSGR
ncbi:hypothetical protein HaLaN_04895 [Haematococcus lacustris]|uniref:Uncharacterized protein n=1 Tax=Haematococcus lacustris TaxID=44745 RepID=A0A699YSE3_HAELA|nr:hypothetical protein HaLaN_04895 [Haematococcus lacustris]